DCSAESRPRVGTGGSFGLRFARRRSVRCHPSGATNATGVVDGTSFTADDLAKTGVFGGGPPTLINTTTYYSALYNSPFSTRWFVITFGTNTSLTTNPGCDNTTGVGTPNGLNFINAIAP